MLSPAAKRLSTVNPNHLSAISLVFALLAGMFFALDREHFLLLAAVAVALNGFFDALDGKVARISSKASKRGDFVDHVIDRYADVLIIGGIALSPHCPVWIGLLAMIGVLLASYMGTQSQALGLSRDYRGILGRADRLMLLIVVPIVQYALVLADQVSIAEDLFGLSLVAWTMVYFALAGNVTALQRAYKTWRSLG